MNQTLMILFVAGMFGVPFVAPAQEPLARPPTITRNFDGAFEPLDIQTDKARITGSLPPGAEDDSAWASVEAEYGPVTDKPFAGAGALRISAREIRQGAVQFRVPRVAVSTNWFAKVKLAVRSSGSSAVRFGIRRVGSPYNYYGERDVTALPEWAVHELLVPPVAEDPAAAFMIELRAPGTIEVDEIEVTYLSRAEVAGRFVATGNLLPSSSFPDGLSAPWSPLHENYAPENYVTDAEVIGPTGLPALRITTAPYERKHIAAVRAPFVGLGDTVYTFSLWAKAAADGHQVFLRVGPPSARLWQDPYQKIIRLGTDWQRYSFTLKLPYASEGFYLAQVFNDGPKGTVWIDGLQVEAAEQPGEFQRTGAVEISLQPVASYGLVHLGEPLQVRAVVYGNIAEGMTLQGELFDVYGRSRRLPARKLAAGATQRLELKLPDKGLSPLGSYRLECRVVDKNGRPVSKISEALLHRVRPARFANQLRPASPFGIHATANSEMPAVMRKLGFTWVRHFGFDWSAVEPEPGRWNFAGMDKIVDNYRQANLCVCGILGRVPRWARSWTMPDPPPPGYNNWHAPNVPPKDLAAWTEYCRRMAERYAGKIEAWETWNEPFLPGFLNAGFENGRYVHPPPEEFLKVHDAAVAGLRQGDPNTLAVVNIGAHYNPPSDTWSKQLIAAGGLRNVDAISYHSYLPSGIGFPGDAIYRATAANTNPDNPQMEVWNTEGGPGPSDIQNFYRHVPPFGKTDRSAYWADYMVRYWISTLASGADKFFLYTAHSWGTWRNDYSPLNVDGRLAPNLIGIANLAWHLEGKNYRQTVELLPGLFAYLFDDDRDSVAVILSKGNARGTLAKLPRRVTARDVFGNDLKTPVKLGDTAVFLDARGWRADALIPALSVR